MRQIFLFLLLAAFLPEQVFAQQAVTSAARHQYDSCLQRVQNERVANGQVYVAWASGLSHTCLLSQYPPKSAKSFAIKSCEKLMTSLRKKFGVRDRCTIVVDRGKIVDTVYRRAVTSPINLPVSIDIFDEPSQKLQPTKGQYIEFPKRFRGLNAVESSFKIQANGISICIGTTKVSASSFKSSFNAKCFGSSFKGSTQADKVTRHRGQLFIVPSKVRVSHRGSWIELRF